MRPSRPSKPCYPTAARRQRGATLVVGMVLMSLLTILALYGAGNELLDLRSSGNEYRAREAMAMAEYGAEEGAAYIRANWETLDPQGWTQCPNAIALPCKAIPNNTTNWRYTTIASNLVAPGTANGTFTLYLLGTSNTEKAYKQIYTIVIDSRSADGSGRAILRQVVQSYSLTGGNAAAPLVAAAGVSLSGNIHIYGNPNGGGTGVPLSVWSNSDVAAGGSPNTYYPNGDPLSSTGNENIDILDKEPSGAHQGVNPDTTNFPSDIFEYTFGVPTADYQKIKTQAQVVANCTGLDGTSKGLIWVTGDCTVNGDVGSIDHPVTLVVQGEIDLNGTGTMYGLLSSFCTAPGATGSCGIKHANGNMTIRGAIVADSATNITSGSLDLRYDAEALANLGNSASGRGLLKLPAAWINWLN